MGLSNTIDKSGVSNPVDRGGVKISSQLVGGVRHNAPGLRPGSTGRRCNCSRSILARVSAQSMLSSISAVVVRPSAVVTVIIPRARETGQILVSRRRLGS